MLAAMIKLLIIFLLTLLLPSPTLAKGCDQVVRDSILYTLDARESHSLWLEQVETHPEQAREHGDVEWHAEWVRRYDEMLSLYFDLCPSVTIDEIDWDSSLIKKSLAIEGSFVMGLEWFALDHQVVVGDPGHQPSHEYRRGVRLRQKYAVR